MKEYKKEIVAMRKLMKLAPRSAAAPTIAKRLEAAAQASTI